jgi:hypothetical protein
VKDTTGLRYLAVLLRHPKRDIHVLDLIDAAEGGVAEDAGASSRVERASGVLPSADRDAGEVLDTQARAAYRRRIEELREEHAEAIRFNDPGRAARAQEEIDALTRELARAMGLGGRPRVAGSAVERARQRINKAIKTSLGHIGERSEPLRCYLEATIVTGTFCTYDPDRQAPLLWAL